MKVTPAIQLITSTILFHLSLVQCLRTLKMTSAPTIVLVPGAFHVDSSFDVFGAELEKAGVNTRSFGLVTVNHAGLTVKDDVQALLTEILNPLIIREGKDVVMYLHSYAGFPGSAAIAGLSKQERSAKGEKGGVVGLIYQSAFCPTPGDTLLAMIGGNYAPWQSPDVSPLPTCPLNLGQGKYDIPIHLTPTQTATGLVNVIDPKQTFYADVKEPLATQAAKQIYGQSIDSFNSASGPVYYGIDEYKDRRVYIHTNDDQALPPFAQDLFVANSGAQWDVRKIDTGHSPFLSDPAQLASLVLGATRGFMATYK
ncbi:MAG: hypothetical protein Q9208_003424 [Pyrenodesmia sp. 3 TL-2023]